MRAATPSPGWRIAAALVMAGLAGPLAAADLPKPPPPAAPATANAGLDKREFRAQLMPRRYTTLAAEIGAKVSRLPVP
ncbi:MAG: hypothetical protein ACM31P_02740, partial [Actinomycetota bacterium]